MRTPLTNIESYLDFLQDPDLSGTERESYLKAASLSEKKIHFLAESFIRMSRLEHRIIRIRRDDTDLLLTLEEAADQVRRKAQEQGLRIRTDFPEKLLHPHDADWLGEAVFNLLDNAVKYSLPAADRAAGNAGENFQEAGSRTGEKNEIAFHTDQSEKDVMPSCAEQTEENEILLGARQNEMFVRIWVSDHGIGIEEGDESKVFQRFYRGSNAKKTEGFGLGLYLTREIVLLHNGFVKLKRQKGGTCVEIYLERYSA